MRYLGQRILKQFGENFAPLAREFAADRSTPLRPAVILDRDGTLIYDEGFTHRVEELKWLPGVKIALRTALEKGYLLVVATNQSGVGRGYYDVSDVVRFHEAMDRALIADGIKIEAYYFCPFVKDAAVPEFDVVDHPDRKPNPGMIRRAVVELGLDPSRSIYVGDRATDKAAADAAGIRGILVSPGEMLAAVTDLVDVRSTPEPWWVDDLKHLADRAQKWMFDELLPFWSERGFDRQSGCFHEQFTRHGEPVEMVRRIMVQARQTAVFARAGRMGWNGPWRELVEKGLEVLLEKAIRPDGGTRHALSSQGRYEDDRRDLYDSAFVIFALAEASIAMGGSQAALDAADRLISWLRDNWAHPSGGFNEGDISNSTRRHQNPHMHFVEALMSLYEADGKPSRLELAAEIIDLSLGVAAQCPEFAIPEVWSHDGKPMFDDVEAVCEPGHQFEWSYLLHCYGQMTAHDMRDASKKLRVTGEVRGVLPKTGFIHERTTSHGRVLSEASRLWTHCERLRAAVAGFADTGSEEPIRAAEQSFEAMCSFFDPPGRVLPNERKDLYGNLLCENVRASSLYHVVFAVCELMRIARES
jgi:mannose-6-phosphate isomerase